MMGLVGKSTQRSRRLMVASVATAGAVAFLVMAAPSAPFAAGALTLQAVVSVDSVPVPCPSNAPPEVAECRERTGETVVPGLGRVSESYTWFFGGGPPTCPSVLAKPLATTGRLVVAGKGEIHFALADGAQCVDVEPVRNEPQNFTIVGGTGAYEGASGSGAVQRNIDAGRGTETWTGTLVVPGREFDLTPPTLRGATAKTVRAAKRARRARVTYTVTASDAVDGDVPVTCQPRSGSRLRIGRTVVKCSATDSSANTATASFRITVRARR